MDESLGDFFFLAADEEHVGREKKKAKELRRSQWWKNQLGKGYCYYCKERFSKAQLTMDHVVPIVRGGKTSRSNVVVCCRECNQEKKYMLPVEWEQKMKG